MNMRYYTVGGDYKKKFRKLDNARKYAIEDGRKSKYYGRTNVTRTIMNEKNEFVGEVNVGDDRRPYPYWTTHYYKFNEYTGREMKMDRRWLLNKDGSLGKKVMG